MPALSPHPDFSSPRPRKGNSHFFRFIFKSAENSLIPILIRFYLRTCLHVEDANGMVRCAELSASRKCKTGYLKIGFRAFRKRIREENLGKSGWVPSTPNNSLTLYAGNERNNGTHSPRATLSPHPDFPNLITKKVILTFSWPYFYQVRKQCP